MHLLFEIALIVTGTLPNRSKVGQILVGAVVGVTLTT
jgi:hypothetical protein